MHVALIPGFVHSQLDRIDEGSAIHSCDLASALTSRAIRVSLIYWGKSPQPPVPGCERVEWWPIPSPDAVDYSEAAYRKALSGGADIVHFGGPQLMPKVLASTAIHSTTIHSRRFLPGEMGEALADDARARLDRIVVLNSEYSTAWAGVRNVVMIPNGINTSLFTPRDTGEEHLGLKVMAPGRINPKKGIRIVLETAERALASGRNMTFSIHRRAWDRDEDKVLPNPLPPNIKVMSWQDRWHRMPMAYANADCLFFPSHRETCPITVLEAMACGLPVVAFGTQALSDLVDHLEDGILVESLNVAEWLHWLERLESEAGLGKHLGANAAKKVLKQYKQEDMADAYLEMWSNAMPT